MGAFFAPSLSSNPLIDPHVIIGGEVSRASGLGEGARVMFQALQKHHISSSLLDISPYSLSLRHYQRAYRVLSTHRYAPLILHINAPQIPFALLSLPRSLLKKRKIIGYWAWELSVLPKDWEAGFRYVHEIWVPSLFVAEAVKPLATKYHKIVRIIPHPIADRINYPVEHITRAQLGLPKDKLVILVSFSLSSSFARKNPIASILAFRKACGNDPNICLILKITYGDEYQEDLKLIKKAIQGYDNIIINKNILSPQENQALIYHSDIVMSLHRSEGFGLVPAEAMLVGKAVIVTNWSATFEFIDQTCGMPVDYQLVPVKDSRQVYELKGAYWAEPDSDMAAQAIKKLIQNPYYRLALGRAACQKTLQTFNSQSLLEGLSAIGVITDQG
ncbi:glycosyltransferase family 4 protein [Commensalibacter oyaizuii]|uniref:Glycosyltransferase family 4 protein n=1 Tax=Commensalibacter oyaizuii TaxID=3043873 RepID=A0ABT6Q039_9PROT|nr:glycosyltransferase family 4 protein [Commensalibacter sp. TBRC 16381]MDI2090333.1 glycosyltransferase family 4 protein [Commensalibacter sp. TBRC 16381]